MEQTEVQRDRRPVRKKLCMHGAAARVASQPAQLPQELVCLILGFMLLDDIGNQDSDVGAVSWTWRGATEWLAEAWAKDPKATPMLASPFVVMWKAGSKMRDAVKGTWSCTYPCEAVLTRRQIRRLLSPLGWLLDETIVLFFRYVLCVPYLVHHNP